MSTFDREVEEGPRFEFGKNWQAFLSTLTDERIEIAETSIKEMLGIENLNGKTVLDIGSGSGLFSLAARKLGAEILSFDFDPASVACTRELRTRYFPNDAAWVVKEGSVLDNDFLESLGRFDIVYSWGVLHHTGSMWTALENAASLVEKHGTLFIAIYNDQGMISKFWKIVKQLYCSGVFGRIVVSGVFVPILFLNVLLLCIRTRENVFVGYKRDRGMSMTHDWFDWLGGLPYEVATVEQISCFFRDRGFILDNLRTTSGAGNNQFVFSRGQAE